MSRNFVPALLAIGMGIFTGYYTFQPALQEIRPEKGNPQGDQKPAQQQPTTKEKNNPPIPSSSASVNDPKAPGK